MHVDHQINIKVTPSRSDDFLFYLTFLFFLLFIIIIVIICF